MIACVKEKRLAGNALTQGIICQNRGLFGAAADLWHSINFKRDTALRYEQIDLLIKYVGYLEAPVYNINSV